MPDYQNNSKKAREEAQTPVKKVDQVITTKVIVQKRSVGRKFKDLMIAADFKTVFHFVGTEVLLPALRNMIVDSSNRGVERLVYGERAIVRRGLGTGPRITYNNPINRGYREDPRGSRYAPAVSPDPRSSMRHSQDNIILTDRAEAELVLERMNDIIESYDVVTIADLNQLIGQPTSHIDNKWGWIYLADVPIRQIREGWLIDFPPAEVIP